MFLKVKICPVCKKKYSWNPDVGSFTCPYCGGLSKENKAKLYY